MRMHWFLLGDLVFGYHCDTVPAERTLYVFGRAPVLFHYSITTTGTNCNYPSKPVLDWLTASLINWLTLHGL